MDKLKTARESGNPFHIVIIDDHLPEEAVVRLSRKIKADAGLKTIDIICMTEKGRRTRGKTCRGSYFSGYLIKPVKRDQLYDCLTELAQPVSGALRKHKSPIVSSHYTAQPQQQNISILLVEDNRVNQMVTQKILSKNGYQVDIANNGIEAIQALEKNHYDLVLMDILMPGMGGYEATRQIRSRKNNVIDPRLPIIALTASALAEDKEKCLSAGMNDYIAKPVKPQELIDKVKKWSGKPQDVKIILEP